MKKAVSGVLVFAAMFASMDVFGWGRPHSVITQAAVDYLPQWQKDVLGREKDNLVRKYCWTPDAVSGSLIKKIKNGEKVRHSQMRAYEVMKVAMKAKANAHLHFSEKNSEKLFNAYLPLIVKSLKEKNPNLAMEYFGVITHYMEDTSCPGHTGYMWKYSFVMHKMKPNVYYQYTRYAMEQDPGFKSTKKNIRKDNVFIHKAIDNCMFTVKDLKDAIGDYKPQLLGKTVAEITKKATLRVKAQDAAGLKALVSMVKLIEKDPKKPEVRKELDALGVKSAKMSVKLIADVLYSTICVATNRFE